MCTASASGGWLAFAGLGQSDYTVITKLNSTAINITGYNTASCSGTTVGSLTIVLGQSASAYGASGSSGGFPTLSVLPSLPSTWPTSGVLLSQYSQPGCTGVLQAYAFFAYTSSCGNWGPLTDVRYTSCAPANATSNGSYTAMLYSSDDGTCSGYAGEVTKPLNAYNGFGAEQGYTQFGAWDIGPTSGYECVTCVSGPPAPSPGPVAPDVTYTPATFEASCPAPTSLGSLSCFSGAQYAIPGAGVCVDGVCGSTGNLNYVAPGPLSCNAGNLTANFPSVCTGGNANNGKYLDAATWANIVAATAFTPPGSATTNAANGAVATSGAYAYCGGFGFTCTIAAMASGLCAMDTPVGAYMVSMAGINTTTASDACANIVALLNQYTGGKAAFVTNALLCATAGCNTASATAASGLADLIAPPTPPPQPSPPPGSPPPFPTPPLPPLPFPSPLPPPLLPPPPPPPSSRSHWWRPCWRIWKLC